jgi:hypothetical protein
MSKTGDISKEIKFSCGTVKLNTEQYNIVISSPNENQRILASAGSGKTTTITARLAYLIEEYEFDPESILLVTFSRVASEEMQQRVKRLVGTIPKHSGTFHGLSLQLLKQYCPEKLKIEPFIDEYPHMFAEWLETPAGVNWRKKIAIIIVDEVQDINAIQWKILMTIKSPKVAMTIVGDDAQNIYTWRGSSVNYILKYHELISNVRDYQLMRNYRSIPEVVTIANATMKYIPTLPYKEKMSSAVCIPHGEQREEGEQRPEVRFFFRASDEIEWVAKSAIEYLKETHCNIGILSRYNSDITRIEDILYKKRVPYRCLQAKNTQEHDGGNGGGNGGGTNSSGIDERIRLTLSTIHASKGLEWDVVYMLNMNDDLFPSEKTDEALICERRLFYVGITRAKYKLYFTYSKNEKYITRFIREIPRPFLFFHSLSTFTNSVFDFKHYRNTLEDLIQGFTGDDWINLRSIDAIPLLATSNPNPNSKPEIIELYSNQGIAGGGGGIGKVQYETPAFIKKLDSRETWAELCKWIFIREFIMPFIDDNENTLEYNLLTDVIRKCLLTIRVYREDYEFWCLYQNELEQTARHFLRYDDSTRILNKIQYDDLQVYIENNFPHIHNQNQWTSKEYLKAFAILAKFRAQLSQVTTRKYSIDDFDFDIVSKCVPIDHRSIVLSSWYSIIDSSKHTCNIIPQLWHIASLYNIHTNGRNIPLYQYYEIKEAVDKEGLINDFLKTIEQSVSTWAIELKDEYPLVFSSATHSEFGQIEFDILTENTAYMLFFPVYNYQTISNDDKLLLLLKTYLAEEMSSIHLQYVGFINISTGVIHKYKYTDVIRGQLGEIVKYLRRIQGEK